MITVWFFIATLSSGYGGVSIAQIGPFATEQDCQAVAKSWIGDGGKAKATPCYTGVIPGWLGTIPAR